MTGEQAHILPRGLFDRDGRRHSRMILRPVTGRFEIRLAEQDDLGAAAVSELLAAAIARIGAYDDIGPEHTAALSRGDRDHALLWIRRGLFGERLQLVVNCPNPSCGEAADLELGVSQIAPPPERSAPEVIKADTPLGPAVLREPTGVDDAEIVGLPPELASAALWSRLVLDLAGRGSLSADDWIALAAPVRYALALALADAGSGPALAFAAPCPSCRAWMEVELDAAALLTTELGVAGDRLFAEVHLLAFSYHWSEEQILALPRERRWRYLDLLRRQQQGQPLLGVRA